MSVARVCLRAGLKALSRKTPDAVRAAFLCSALVLGGAPQGPAFADYAPIDAVVGVKTRFSDGCSTVSELGNIAQHRGIDAVIYGDHDQRSLEYGIWPLERIFKKKDAGPSILSLGAEGYLSEIEQNKNKFKDLLMVPAVDSAPFYYWTGSVFDKSLVANNWDKRLLVVGLQTPEDYERLPVLNGPFSGRYARKFVNEFFFCAVLFLVLLGMVYKRVARKLTVPLCVFAFLLALSHHPFRSSPFDQYHGDRGAGPYQELIDYAVSRGAMVFWSSLEPGAGAGIAGSVGTNTPPHPQDLTLTENYTGFQAVSDRPVPAAEPGNEWDRALVQFIQGKRKYPVWAYGSNDFHCEGQDDRTLGGVRTVLLVRDKSVRSVHDAMLHGRMYAVRQSAAEERLSLDQFSVSDGAASALPGEELVANNAPEVKVKVGSTRESRKAVKISIVRNGELVKEERGVLPLELVWKDEEAVRKGRAFYRVKAELDANQYLLSNPVFVRFSEKPPQVASLETLSVKLPPLQAEQPAGEPRIPQPKEPSAPQAPKPQEPVMAGPPAPRDSEPAERSVALPQFPAVKEPVKPGPPAQPAPAGRPPQPETKAESRTSAGPKPRYVVPRIDGVVLKRSPDPASPQLAAADKGEKLLLVERTETLYNDKPWLLVRKGKLNAYVWEPLVKEEP
ncbi:MAG: hypothetical protein HY579_07560 [Nitrospinae bacterium]|nr:hypothetical protein [Nitrospinota bacterium]